MNDARILLVDDDVALLEALPQAILLRMERVQIDTSETATDALERIKEVDYDAIVTDIKMPVMDGLALLEEIGKVRPGTPTLLITGHGEHDLAVRALRGGAYDFVAKPIDRDYFIASLERAIGMRRLDREVERQRLALERHASVLEHVDDGVFLVDDAGAIQHWNPAAAAITGLTPSAVLGQRADDVLPDWRAVCPTIPIASVPGPGSTAARTLPFVIEGREVWLSISGVAFDDGVVYAFRNLTEERALDELKGEFVATVSHELRGPLTSIYGFAETLLREDVLFGEEERMTFLRYIASESERLTTIVDALLNVARLDTGDLTVSLEPTDVASVVSEVVTSAVPSGNGHRFVADVAVEGVAVQADPDKLRQVLDQLISNALKYSPDGGTVTVSARCIDDAVELAVADEGVGIPQAERERIFSKFYKAGGGQGTGLGLFIAQGLVREMGGRMWVDSEEGRGSRFAFELPLAARDG